MKHGTTRVNRQAAERKYWKQEVADLLILMGIFGPEEPATAAVYATKLMYRNLDENGELMVSPKEAIEDDCNYPQTTMS
ncbi:hypothetical protein D3C81_1070710 [compost metagenome]